MHEHGEGVPKDNAKALEWYRKAAAQGLDSAKQAVTRLESLTATPTYNAQSASLESQALANLAQQSAAASAPSSSGNGEGNAGTQSDLQRRQRIQELTDQIADVERDALDNDHLAEQADELSKQGTSLAGSSGGVFGQLAGIIGAGAGAGKGSNTEAWRRVPARKQAISAISLHS